MTLSPQDVSNAMSMLTIPPKVQSRNSSPQRDAPPMLRSQSRSVSLDVLPVKGTPTGYGFTLGQSKSGLYVQSVGACLHMST